MLKSTIPTPHGICFAKQKKFVNQNKIPRGGLPCAAGGMIRRLPQSRYARQLPQEGAKGITASQIMAQAGFPYASSQRSKFRKPLCSSRLCSDARCSSSQKTRCATFSGALSYKSFPRAKPRFASKNKIPRGGFPCARALNLQILLLKTRGKIFPKEKDFREISSRNLFCEAKEIREPK